MKKFVGGRIGYAKRPFDVAVAYGRTQVYNDTDGDNFNVGGSWNFGVMTLTGYYGQIKVDNDKQDNWFIGASAPIGAWTLKASYGKVERSGELPVNVEGQRANQFAVGGVYDLSKRTALYGTWVGITNKGAQVSSSAASTTSPAAARRPTPIRRASSSASSTRSDACRSGDA